MINKINALIGFLRKYEILIRDALSGIVNKILSKSNFLFILPAAMMLARGGRYLFVRPQLYAEDGAYWMSNAYSIGLKNITLPYASQYHTAEKLFAYASSFLPIEWQPFIYNLTAFIIFIIMCYLLLDKKSGIVRDPKQALILAFMLGLVQNIEELAFNFSNSVFYLGIIGVVLLWRNYSSRIKNSLKYVFYGITCVTLPFSLFYAPIALFRFVKNKKIDEAITLGISVLGAATKFTH